MRVAVYVTPPADDPLTRAAAEWLGRSAFTDTPTRPADPELDRLVADPARYGSHATIRAPFRIREGYGIADIEQALERFAATREAFVLPHIEIARLGAFFAFVPQAPSPALADLEGAALDAFEPYRAPLDEAEIARRRPSDLTPPQRRHLDRWGYPFVRDEFRFHMTLTGAVPADAAAAVESRLRERFAPFVGRPLRIGGLALFVEEQAGKPFRVAATAPFGG